MHWSRAALTSALLTIVTVAQAMAWGDTGHRVTGAIAEHYLSSSAASVVRDLLGPESLAEASTWPDFVRSDPAWKKAEAWHFVKAADGLYKEGDAPPKGDAFTALKTFTITLRDANAPLADRQAALRFIVHIVGDLHQPLHVGCKDDSGGNGEPVIWFGQASQLHRVWDSQLIDHENLSYSELAGWLNAKITSTDVASWTNPDPLVWMEESRLLCGEIYPAKADLGYDYAFKHIASLHRRLQQAGVRIAAYLNSAFPN